MKDKLKEILINDCITFCIGGVLGIIYGAFISMYSYDETIVVIKNLITMFLLGGFIIILVFAAAAIVGVCLSILIQKILK